MALRAERSVIGTRLQELCDGLVGEFYKRSTETGTHIPVEIRLPGTDQMDDGFVNLHGYQPRHMSAMIMSAREHRTLFPLLPDAAVPDVVNLATAQAPSIGKDMTVTVRGVHELEHPRSAMNASYAVLRLDRDDVRRLSDERAAWTTASEFLSQQWGVGVPEQTKPLRPLDVTLAYFAPVATDAEYRDRREAYTVIASAVKEALPLHVTFRPTIITSYPNKPTGVE